MKYCNQCGSTMPDNVFFCANCGATLGGANLNNGYTRPDQPYMSPNAMPQAYVPVQPEPVRTGGNLPASEQSEFFNQNGFGQPPISAYAPAYAQPDNIAEPAAAHAGSLPSLQTFDDFYELVASKKTKSFYRWLGVLCVLNVVLNLAMHLLCRIHWLTPLCLLFCRFWCLRKRARSFQLSFRSWAASVLLSAWCCPALRPVSSLLFMQFLVLSG